MFSIFHFLQSDMATEYLMPSLARKVAWFNAYFGTEVAFE